MAYLLGVDTGGTYTDAVVLHEAEDRVVASAKSLTTRPDLSVGVGRAIDAAIAQADVSPSEIGMVSLSTTLATNALVEGQGGRVALIFIGFEAAELARAGLEEAMKGDPVVRIAGGHNHAGAEAVPLDMVAIEAAALRLGPEVTGFAVASAFATRNPAHEIAARDAIRALAHRPVTCSHELSAGLNGPRRALTAVLNARLIGMIDGLITACEAHMETLGIVAPLMVVRGDGALVSAGLARERPIETILSGPAASIAGASWLSGETEALVSDIGGTTTDVCLLREGKPQIDPLGARVGPYRTMVEAVAMRTTGLGGDSEVHLIEGLNTGLRLGPRRLMPVSLAARDWPDLVHGALDAWLGMEAVGEHDGRFAIPLWKDGPPAGLAPREAAVAERLLGGPMRIVDAVRTRLELPALMKLVSRGAVWHGTAGDVAAECDVVITIVGYPKDVEETYLGAGGIILAVMRFAFHRLRSPDCCPATAWRCPACFGVPAGTARFRATIQQEWSYAESPVGSPFRLAVMLTQDGRGEKLFRFNT